MSKVLFPERVSHLLDTCSGLCVGFDPSTELLHSWRLTDDQNGLRQYHKVMVNACLNAKVGFVKPQIAFYERFGWQGLQLLTEMSIELRSHGILVILDCKRGDIGSTASAYADAYLSAFDLSKYEAITVNPFLGFSSLSPFIELIKRQEVGIFVIVRSSNEDSSTFQTAQTESGISVAAWLAQKIKQENQAIFGEAKLGAVGAVIGSTLNDVQHLLEQMSTSFFLCPGIGAQGATFKSAVTNLGHFAKQCIFPVSRGLTSQIESETQLIARITAMRTELTQVLLDI